MYDACFTLQFGKDKNNEDIGILICPYVKWFSVTENDIWLRIYQLSGKELECIDKQYFDNNVVEISVDGYHRPVEMEDIFHQVVPAEIIDKIMNGTYNL